MLALTSPEPFTDLGAEEIEVLAEVSMDCGPRAQTFRPRARA